MQKESGMFGKLKSTTNSFVAAAAIALSAGGLENKKALAQEVKIGETVVTFGENGQKNEVKNATAVEILNSQLDVLGKYFQSTDVEWEILRKNPSSRVVCEFVDTFMRNETNRKSLEIIWKFLDKNEENLGQEFKSVVDKLLKEARGKTRGEVGEILGQPAPTGTTCGFVFNLAYATISSEKKTLVQNLVRELVVKLVEFLKGRIEKDEEAKQIARILINLVFDQLPEQNR